MKRESSSSIVYRTVGELPAGATFTSRSISHDLDWNDPSLVSACFRALKDDGLIHEIGVGPGRTITYQRTAIPAKDRKFKSALRKPRTMNREPGYTLPNAGRPDLPRIAGEAAPRARRTSDAADLFGVGSALADAPEPAFPNADRLDRTEKVDVTLDKPRVGPVKTERDPALPNFVKIGELLYPVGPLTADPEKRLSVQIREIADRIEALEDVIDLAAKKLGLPLK